MEKIIVIISKNKTGLITLSAFVRGNLFKCRYIDGITYAKESFKRLIKSQTGVKRLSITYLTN